MPEEKVVELQGQENPTEKELVIKFIENKKTCDELDAMLKQAVKDRDDAEAKLLRLLEDDGKQATARYEGIGYFLRMQGAAHASIQKGMQEEVQKYLKSIGREDMVRETVAAASLSAFVRDCLKCNEPLPPGVTFYVPSYLRHFDQK